MSFSKELKNYLQSIQEKKQCCQAAFDAGMSGTAPKIICQKDQWVYLRGVFVSSGTINDPKKSFRLTLYANQETLDIVEKILISNEITPNYGTKQGKPVLYLRSSEKIEDFLAIIGASRYSLEIMEDKVIRDMRLAANRLSNAEVANISKSVLAANKQQEAIETLKRNKAFEVLPSELRESAELRLQYPELSLDELRLKLKKPLSKSGLNHRLNRLVELADKYKGS